MTRFFVSLLIGIALGSAIGLVIGWGVFPAETVGNPINELSQAYQDEYTAMVAAGFRADNDRPGAIERLEYLGVESVPSHVQAVTERYILNSRDVNDIYNLVVLADVLGVLTDTMRPFLAAASS
jgi:hypothetical protein